MISYKVLIILTVIFYIITYRIEGFEVSTRGPEPGVTTGDNTSSNVTMTIETFDYKYFNACQYNLIKLKFKLINPVDEITKDSGFYNLLLVLQFNNDEDFKKYIKEKLDDENIEVMDDNTIDQTTTNNEAEALKTEFMQKYNIETKEQYSPKKIISVQINDQPSINDIASFIYRFYKDASKSGLSSKDFFKSPQQYCETESQAKDCFKSIKKFEVEIKDIKFDVNNKFKCYITLKDYIDNLTLSHGPDKVKEICNQMEEYQRNYIQYLMAINKYDKDYRIFNAFLLCKIYVYENIKLLKIETEENEGSNQDQ